MALNDKDLEAIAHVRGILPHMPREDVEPLNRLLALAGEEPPEPEDQTFWYDPQDRIVYQRDELANPGFGRPWYGTGRMTGEDWSDMGSARNRLVQLVPVSGDQPPKELVEQLQEVLMELLGSWESRHREKCGGSKPLSRCHYSECLGAWQMLHHHGVRTTWERDHG